MTAAAVAVGMHMFSGGVAHAQALGAITTVAGDGISSYGGDFGPATAASLEQPSGIAFDSAGNVYVADQATHTVRKFTPGGQIVPVAGTGSPGATGDGLAAVAATLNGPSGLAFDKSGNLYIADTGNNKIRVVSPSGIITTFAGTGTANYTGDKGPASAATLNGPRGLAVDQYGNLFVSDSKNNVVRTISTAGTITTYAGTGSPGNCGTGSPPLSTCLRAPRGLAFDLAGNLYISDSGNNRVLIVTSGGGSVSAFAGSGTAGFGGDGGPAVNALLNAPQGIAFDPIGNLYIGDSVNNRVRIVTPYGLIFTLAGTGTAGYSGDGAAAITAQLNTPGWPAVTYSGAVYVSDLGNSVVRVIGTGLRSGPPGVIGTLAGTGVATITGDGGPAWAATLSQPAGLAFDHAGNLYVADQTGNDIREITPAGAINSYIVPIIHPVGLGLQSPHQIAIDSAQNLYIADTTDNEIRLAPPPSAGAGLDVIAGISPPTTGSYSGDNGPAISAYFNAPRGIAVDSSGNVYVADSANNEVRQLQPVDSGGYTVVPYAGIGNGTSGNAPNNSVVFARGAGLNTPRAVAIDPNTGNLYIADSGNNVVRVVTPGPTSCMMTVAGNGSATGALGDGGPATAASLSGPRAVAVDSAGNLWIADYGHNLVRVVVSTSGALAPTFCNYGFVPNGVIFTIAGDGLAQYAGDGGAANLAGVSGPDALAFDANDNLYIADLNDARVREVFYPSAVIPNTLPLSGQPVSVTPVDGTSGLTPATITFSNLTGGGQTTLTTGISAPAPPATLTGSACTPELAMTISTTATFSGSATICVAPSALGSTCAPNTVLYHYTGGSYQALPQPGTVPSGEVCGVTTSFSPFALLAPVGVTPQAITIGAIGSQTLATPSITVGASASSGLPVTLSSRTTTVCTVAGTTVTLLVTGTCTIAADQPGNLTYAPASEVTQSFSVSGAAQTISFAPIAAQSLATPTLVVSATASSGLAVTFSSLSSSVCTVAGSTVTLLTAGTCTIAADQAGNATYAAAAEVAQSFAVTSPLQSQTISFPTIPSQTLATHSLTVTVSASSGLPVTLSTTSAACSVSGSTITLIAAGLCTITATQAGNANYLAATPVAQSFTISAPQPQTISFAAIANQLLSAGSVVASASASSGLTVTIASQTGATCSVNGTTVTLIAAGTCTLQATQAGNANYLAATPVGQSFTISAGSGGGSSSGGGAAPSTGDGPLPLWAFGALGAALFGVARRRFKSAG